MTSYEGKRRPPESDAEPPEKRQRVDNDITDYFPAALPVHARSGDEELEVPSTIRDDRALVTTFDSLHRSSESDLDLLFIDELSKNRVQVTLKTMDTRPNKRDRNFKQLGATIAMSRLLVAADAGMEADDVNFVRKHRGSRGAQAKTTNILYNNSHYRLDARFVKTEVQLMGSILRSVIVERKNTVIASSTNGGAKAFGDIARQYCQGKRDLFMNKVNRSSKEVINEVASIHRIETCAATALLERVLNGCNHICGDGGRVMRAAKKLLLERSLATEHNIWKKWRFNGEEWVEHTLHRAQRSDVVVLSFSPSITVGVSFETLHFSACYALFGNVIQHADTLIQMLRRFRSIFVVNIYLGTSAPRKSLEDRLRAANISTERYHEKEMVQQMDPGVLEVYQEEDAAMQPQLGSHRALRKAVERALFHSNAFNVVRDVPVLNTAEEHFSGDAGFASIEAMVDAKVLTSQSQLAGALPEERGKFNLLNRLFPGNELPACLSKRTQRFMLHEKESFRFLANALLQHKKDAVSVSPLVIDNFTNTFRANFRDTEKLLACLGFHNFSHLLDWCAPVTSRRGRPSKEEQLRSESLRPGRFSFNNQLVDNVKDRLGISWKDNKKKKRDPDPVDKTVRCLTKVLSKECPRAFHPAVGIMRERKIHGLRTQRFRETDLDFLNLFRTIMSGKEPNWDERDSREAHRHPPGQVSDAAETTDTATDNGPDPTFKSKLGTLIAYQNFT